MRRKREYFLAIRGIWPPRVMAFAKYGLKTGYKAQKSRREDVSYTHMRCNALSHKTE